MFFLYQGLVLPHLIYNFHFSHMSVTFHSKQELLKPHFEWNNILAFMAK